MQQEYLAEKFRSNYIVSLMLAPTHENVPGNVFQWQQNAVWANLGQKLMKHCFIISVFWFNMDVALNRLAKGCVSLVNPEECNLLCVGTSGGHVAN